MWEVKPQAIRLQIFYGQLVILAVARRVTYPLCVHQPRSQDRKYSSDRDHRRQKTNWLETDSPADESNLPIYCVRTRSRPISVKLEVNEKTTDYGGGY